LQGWIASVLSWRPVVFIGLISYSLYLWHWPVICFTSYWAVAEFSALEKWGLILASVGLAVTSWRWVETPFRNKEVFTSRRYVACMALLVSAAVGFVGWLGYQSDGFPRRVNLQVLAVLEDLKRDKAERQKLAHLAPNRTDYSQVSLKSLPRIGLQEAAPLTFAVFGDSHAQVAMPLFDELAKKHLKSGVAITHQGTPPLLGWNIIQKGGAADPAGLWNAAFEFTREEKIQDVFLLGHWSSYDQAEISLKVVETIEKFSNAGINVWILLGAPTYDQNVARMYVRDMFFGDFTPESEFVANEKYKNSISGAFSLAKEKFSMRTIDALPVFVHSCNGNYRIANKGYLYYFDSNHLTLEGNRFAYSNKIEIIMSNKFQSLQ
jgi:hypothetical protein